MVPPPPTGIASSTHTAPPAAGYVAFGSPGAPVQPLQSTAGLRTATLVLFWVTVAANVLFAVVLFNRRSVWDDFVAGNAGFVDLDDADNAVGAVALLLIVSLLASGIVLSIWSLRTARNAKARGALAVSPGLACGGWYIPIGNLWVGFGQLRKSVDGVRGGAPNLSKWQGAWIGFVVLGFVTRSFGNIDTFDPDGVSESLQNQSIAGVLQALTMAVAAFFAMRAMREIDRSVNTLPT